MISTCFAEEFTGSPVRREGCSEPTLALPRKLNVLLDLDGRLILQCLGCCLRSEARKAQVPEHLKNDLKTTLETTVTARICAQAALFYVFELPLRILNKSLNIFRPIGR
jgi:hypothetical protein